MYWCEEQESDIHPIVSGLKFSAKPGFQTDTERVEMWVVDNDDGTFMIYWRANDQEIHYQTQQLEKAYSVSGFVPKVRIVHDDEQTTRWYHVMSPHIPMVHSWFGPRVAAAKASNQTPRVNSSSALE